MYFNQIFHGSYEGLHENILHSPAKRFGVVSQPSSFQYHSICAYRLKHLPVVSQDIFEINRFKSFTQLLAKSSPYYGYELRITNVNCNSIDDNASSIPKDVFIYFLVRASGSDALAAKKRLNSAKSLFEIAFPQEYPYLYQLLPANDTEINNLRSTMRLLPELVIAVPPLFSLLSKKPEPSLGNLLLETLWLQSISSILSLSSNQIIVSIQFQPKWPSENEIKLIDEFRQNQNPKNSLELLFTRINILGDKGAGSSGELDLIFQMLANHQSPEHYRKVTASSTKDNFSFPFDGQVALGHPADYRQDLDVIFFDARRANSSLENISEGMRFCKTYQELASVICLPALKEMIHFPGISVKREPFSLRNSDIESIEPGNSKIKVDLGEALIYGRPSGKVFGLSLANINHHVLIAGTTGSGKTTTILTILSQLEKLKIPYLVLYPINKTDYRQLLNQSNKNQVLIYTLGKNSLAPFRFDPFVVADKVSVRQHISRLLNVFIAAYDLSVPMELILSKALKGIYKLNGWDVGRDLGEDFRQGKREFPTLRQFCALTLKIAENLKYGRNLSADISQATRLRTEDLLLNLSDILVSDSRLPAFDELINKQIVMELGGIGSAQNINLVMGFLFLQLSEHIESRGMSNVLKHVTVIEEAHRLMPEIFSSVGNSRSSLASEEISSLLAEMRGFGEGVIVSDQMPARINKSAIGNTNLKLMHRVEDILSFEQISDSLNMNDIQKSAARNLNVGQVVVRGRSGYPFVVDIKPTLPFSSIEFTEDLLRKNYAESITYPLGDICRKCPAIVRTGKCLCRRSCLRRGKDLKIREILDNFLEDDTKPLLYRINRVKHIFLPKPLIKKDSDTSNDNTDKDIGWPKSEEIFYCLLAHESVKWAINPSSHSRVKVCLDACSFLQLGIQQ